MLNCKATLRDLIQAIAQNMDKKEMASLVFAIKFKQMKQKRWK